MGLNLEITLEMGDRGFGSSTGAATTFLASQMYLNPADYDGATYYWEICALNNHATLSYDVSLMEGANVMATHTLAAATPTGAGNYIRLRSSSFVPTAGNQIYKLRIAQTAVASNVVVYACRIVVVQVNATITRLQFPLASKTTSSNLDTTGVNFHTSSSTTYAQQQPECCLLFKLEKTLLATIAAGSPWSWETVAYKVGANAVVGLFDATANAQIGTIENVHSSINTATIVTQDFADSALTDGNDLEVRCKAATASGMGAIAARLYVRLTSLTKAAVYRRVGVGGIGAAGTATRAEARQLINTSLFSTPLIYFEGTGWESSAGTVVLDLNDQSTADDGVGAGTNVAGTTLTFDGLTKIRQRSAALTLTSGNRFVPRFTRSSGTQQQAGPVLLIVAEQTIVILDYPYSGATGLVAGNLAAAEYGAIPATLGVAAILGATGGMAAAAIPSTGLALILGTPAGLLAGSTVGTIMGPVVLVSIFLDSGTEYAAAAEVRHPSRLYEGRVIACGTVERSIPIPVGLPSIGNLSMTFADTDHYWRGVLSQRTPYRRLLEVKIGVEGGSEVLFLTAYRGEIRGVHFSQESVSIEAADITARWLDNPIPPLINRTNFPNTAVEDAFFPIVLGYVADPSTIPTGAIPCYLIDTTLNRYTVSRTPSTVIALYKKMAAASFSPPASTDQWVLVDPGDYTVSEVTHEIDGVEYDYTVVDFAVSVDVGSPPVFGSTEVRADVNGTQGRGAFGTMPGVTGTLRNPIDALINMSYYGFLAANQVVRFDTASFEVAHAQLEELAWYCDGAIVDPMTFREFLGQFLPCFSLDVFQNRRAELAVKLTQGGDADRPVFNDLEHILQGSVRQDLPDPCYNRIVYKWARLYAAGLWPNTTVFNNEEDQAETILLDEDPPTPKIQSETVELNFIRDADTAIAVMGERSQYQALASYRFHCDLSAPQVLDLVELATRIGITHAGGIAPGGWVNEEFKIYRESLNLDDLRLTISGVRRPVPPRAGAFIPAAWSHNARPGPWYVNPKTLYLALQPNADRSTLNIYKSADWGDTWAVAAAFNATNEIISFDVEQEPANTNVLHVAIQELVTGRVSYHQFSMTTDTWVVEDEEIVASVTQTDLIHFGNVSVTVRKISLEAVIAYEGDLAIPYPGSGGDRRWKFVRRTGVNTYTAAADVSGTTPDYDIGGGRVVAGAEDRVHFFYFRQPMAHLGSGNGDMCSRTLNAANALSTENAWLEPMSPAFYSSEFPIGNPCSYSDGSDKIAFLYRGNFAAPFLAVFNDIDDPGSAEIAAMVTPGFLYQGQGTYPSKYPQGIVRYVRGRLRVAWSRFSSAEGPGWIDYAHAPGIPDEPPIQISPYFPRNSTENQGFSAIIYGYGSDLYFGELIYCAGPGAGLPESFGCVFCLEKASSFPLGPADTINAWADEFLS